MADPFEVRMRFTAQLQHLNASLTSSQKAAQYALKYKDMDEDLHSCILEQLEKNSMNNRANILYFLDSLCDLSAPSAQNHPDYIRMMQRDILRIVDACAPEDGSGAANIKVVRRILEGFERKGVLSQQTVDEINELLSGRDAGMQGVEDGSSPAKAQDGGDPMDIDGPTTSQRPSKSTPYSLILEAGKNSASPDVGPPAHKLDKKLIEQRIEEDRERHKRLREMQWAVPAKTEDEEFERLWDETSELGSDDLEVFDEEGIEREQCARSHAEEVEGREEPLVA